MRESTNNFQTNVVARENISLQVRIFSATSAAAAAAAAAAVASAARCDYSIKTIAYTVVNRVTNKRPSEMDRQHV